MKKKKTPASAFGFDHATERERESFTDELLVRIHLIIVMIRWIGLAPWEFEFHSPDSLATRFWVCGFRVWGEDAGLVGRTFHGRKFRGSGSVRTGSWTGPPRGGKGSKSRN